MTMHGDPREPRPQGGDDPRRHDDVPAAAGAQPPRDPDVADLADDVVVAHQPADADDLRRFPARDATCAGMRALLRDRVDGDLAADAADAVDEHVHRCRDCALALARMELEVLRIRRALEPEQRAVRQVPREFTAAVMRAVGDAVLQDRTAPEPARTRVTPPDFTRNVMERVRLEWRRAPLWQRTVDRIGMPATAAITAVAAAALVLVLAWAFEPAAVRRDGLLVLAARNAAVCTVEQLAVVDADDPARTGRAVHAGETVRPGSAVVTGAGGSFVGTLLGAAGSTAGPAPLDPLSTESIGRSQVRLGSLSALVYGRDGALALRSGSLEHGAPRRSTIAVGIDALPPPDRAAAGANGGAGAGDGALVHLLSVDDEPGEASIQVTPVYREDMPREAWKARVEVTGGAIEIEVAGRGAQRIVRGQVAYFDNLGDWRVDLSPSAALAGLRDPAGGIAAATAGAVANPPGYFDGLLVRADTGKPVRDGRIEILAAGEPEPQWRRSGSEGGFDFLGDAGARLPNDRPPVVIRAWPPASATDLAPSVPVFVDLGRLVSDGGVVRVELPLDRPLGGAVYLADGRRAAKARITPLWIDELFGRIEAGSGLATVGDGDGRFVLRGVPAHIAPHESLALLVTVPGHPPAIVRPDGALAGDLGLEFRLPAPQQVTVAGLPARQWCELVEAVPGVPVGALAIRHQVLSDAEGRAELEAVGTGSLLLLDRDADQVRLLVEVGGERRAQGEPAAFVAEGMVGIGTEDVGSDRRSVWLRAGRRIDQLATADEGVRTVVTAVDAGSGTPRDATVFARLADGRIVVVGRQQGLDQARFALPVARPVHVFAIGDAGEFGVVELGEGAGAPLIAMQAAGGVDLTGVVQPGARVVLEARDGALTGRILWRRTPPTSAVIPQLVPGSYRIGTGDGVTRDVTVAPGVITVLPRPTGGAPGEADPGRRDPAQRR